MTRRARIVSVLLLVVLALAAALVHRQRQAAGAANATSASGAKAAGGNAAPGAVPVVLGTLQTRDVPLRIKAVGRTEPLSTVTLRSRTDGQVLSVGYQAGRPVKRGQVMATLDARVQQAQLAQAEAALARDQAQLDKARSDLERYAGLVERGFVSAAQLEVYRAAVATLQATIQAGRASVDLARTQMSYATIRAPIDGVAGAVLVHPGNTVRANDTSLVVINQIQPIQVTFSLPESRLADVPRDRVGLLKVQVKAPGAGSAMRDGELVFVDNAVDPATGTIQLKARLPNRDEALTPGQFVEVSMTLRDLKGALMMPSEALQSGPEGGYVYRARPDGTVEMRKVRTLAVGEPDLVVLEGLAAGDRVVTDGQLRLTPGARFEARGEASNQTAPARAPGDSPA